MRSSTTASIDDQDEAILMPQFDDLDQQQVASNLGMWMFLATEVMFFGGLIAAYVVYRALSPHEFALASRHLKLWLGCVNTVVLLGSSLAMALAVRSAQLRRRREVVWFLLLTMGLGLWFLGIKAIEYYQEYRESLIPGLNFRLPEHGAPTTDPADLSARRFEMFFVLYFFMTWLHAFHLIIGIVLVGVIAYLVWRRWFSGGGEAQVEVAGLYWHFVDVVWVFLYPLLYLIDVRS
jgi:cytochrome c oxidase subunit 3